MKYSSKDARIEKNSVKITDFNLGSYYGIGGRTVDKVFQYDLPFIKNQFPDIVILELGTNDLSDLSPKAAGSRLEKLVLFFKNDLNVRTLVLCQVIDRYISHSQTLDFEFYKKAGVLR